MSHCLCARMLQGFLGRGEGGCVGGGGASFSRLLTLSQVTDIGERRPNQSLVSLWQVFFSLRKMKKKMRSKHCMHDRRQGA